MNPYVVVLVLVSCFFSGWQVNGWRLKYHYEQFTLKSINDAKEEFEKRVALVRTDERKTTENLEAVAKGLQTNLTDKEKELEKARASVRAGFQRLFDVTSKQCPPILPSPAPTGRGDDAARDPGLLNKATDFFGGEAQRANKVVEKLLACQATVIEYQRLCR